MAPESTTTQPNTSPASAPNPWLAGKSIVIAGAGISGLALAISLSAHWPASACPAPHITILERDTYANRVGREGYTLSLRTDAQSGGVQALDRMGLYEAALAASVPGAAGGALVIRDRQWNALLRVAPAPTGEKALRGMRIRRNALQRVLADAAGACGVEVRWGVRVEGAERMEGGGVRVRVEGGTGMECDLLVAADGSGSRIRAVVRPAEGLDFAGAVCLSGTGNFEREEQVPKPLDRDWGPVLGGRGHRDGVMLFASPVDSHSALWSLSYRARDPRAPARHPLPGKAYQTLMDEAKDLGADFGPKLHELIAATDPATFMLFNAMDRPPFAHDIDRHGPIVWVGDANHAVSPFAGNGANMALMDAWDLAACLCKASSLPQAAQTYDQLAMPRAKATVNMSRWTIRFFHARGLKLWLLTMALKVINFFLVTMGRHGASKDHAE